MSPCACSATSRWAAPSVLPGMPVSALAGHLARQVFGVERLLAARPGAKPPISLLDHYARSAWPTAGPDDEASAGIRRDAAAEAAPGPAALADRAADTARRLSGVLAGEPADRVVLVPWGPWPLTLDDLLVSRLMEIAVHDDDLALSVGLPTPEQPADVTDLVLALLSRLAARRHGFIVRPLCLTFARVCGWLVLLRPQLRRYHPGNRAWPGLMSRMYLDWYPILGRRI
jgi:Mycothiol maleylpyruvate isomerase N-terminal domain